MEKKKCKDCRYRQRFGYCFKTEQYVPKKKRKNGENPANDCKNFSRK